nr:G protein-coupled receptor [Proales similis]
MSSVCTRFLVCLPIYLLICWGAVEADCRAALPNQPSFVLQWLNEEPAECDLHTATSQGYLNVRSTAYNVIDRALVAFFTEFTNSLRLARFGEIQLDSGPFHADQISLIFQTFKFKFNGRPLTQDSCKMLIHNRTDYSDQLFGFPSASSVVFKHGSFLSELCPLMFGNGRFDLSIDDLSQSMIKTNHMLFDEWQAQVNCSLLELQLGMYRTHLRPVELSNALMQNTTSLRLIGQIDSIQSDLFGYFRKLERLTIKNSNLRELFHRGLDWMSNLNQRYKPLEANWTYLDPAEKVRAASDRLFVFFIIEQPFRKGSIRLNNTYGYPDADLCLFKRFPHQRLVLPFLINDQRECTCTAFFLKKQVLEIDPLDGRLGSALGWLVNINSDMNENFITCDLDEMQAKCDLEKRLDQCQLQPSGSLDSSGVVLTYEDTLTIMQSVQYVFNLYLMPVACLASLTSNSLLLITLRRYDMLQENLMQFMWMAGVFNIALTLTYPLDLFSLCLGRDSIFCSSMWSSLFAQYAKIVVSGFLQNLFKFASSMCLLMVSAHRYALASGQDQHRFVKRLVSLSRSRLIAWVLFVGTLLSVVKIFQYSVKDVQKDPFLNEDYIQLPLLRSFVLSSYYLYGSGPTFAYDLLSLSFYFLFDLLNVLCSHIGCFLLNMWFDVLLFRVTRSNLKAKTRLYNEYKTIAFEKVAEAEATSHRVIKLVVLSSASSFLLRLPDVLLSFYFSISYALSRFNLLSINSLCEVNPAICSTLFDIDSQLYVLSTSLPFFFLLGFSRKFSQTFKEMGSARTKF